MLKLLKEKGAVASNSKKVTEMRRKAITWMMYDQELKKKIIQLKKSA